MPLRVEGLHDQRSGVRDLDPLAKTRANSAALQPTGRPAGSTRRDLASERLDHVREHGLELCAKGREDRDDHDRDQHQDERVLNHRLTSLAKAGHEGQPPDHVLSPP